MQTRYGWLNLASPNKTIIPSALETPMNDIETDAICATVMRFFGGFLWLKSLLLKLECANLGFANREVSTPSFCVFSSGIGDRTVPEL